MLYSFFFCVYRGLGQVAYLFIWLIHSVNEKLRKDGSKGLVPQYWDLAERMGLDLIGKSSNRGLSERVWFHCASLGESKGLLGLLLASNLNEKHLLITCQTHKGKQFWLKNGIAALQSQCNDKNKATGLDSIECRIAPLDISNCILRLLHHYCIGAFCLYESELWPNLIKTVSHSGLPVFWSAAKMNFQGFRKLFPFRMLTREIGKSFTQIEAQGKRDAIRLRHLGFKVNRVGVDYKALYQELQASGGESESLSLQASIQEQVKEKELGAGLAFLTAYLSEVKQWRSVIACLPNHVNVIIFPKKMNECNIMISLLAEYGFTLYSQNEKASRLIVDCYGKVGQLLGKDSLVKVTTVILGGTFLPVGGHSPWESIAMGKTLICGPYYFNQEAIIKDLLHNGAAHIFGSVEKYSNSCQFKELLESKDEKSPQTRLSEFKTRKWWQNYRMQAIQSAQQQSGYIFRDQGNGSFEEQK